MGQRNVRTRDVVLVLLVTAVQFGGPRLVNPVHPPRALTGVAGALLLVAAVVAQGISLLWRRRRPASALTVCLSGYAVNLALVPGVPPFAGWVVLYAVGVRGSPEGRRSRGGVLGAAVLVSLIALGAIAYPPTLSESVLLALITVIVALLATVIRSRRAEMDALRERAAALERERESAVARAAAEERLRIARDLHDLVGHGLSGIAVQSGTARLALDKGRLDQARDALAAVEASSRAALTEMRHLLGLLRGDDAGGYGPAPGIHDLPDVVDRLRTQGVRVELSAGDLGGLPEAASLGAFRIAQEALTNAVKHAPGSRITVDVDAADGTLSLVVEDHPDAPVAPSAQSGGGQGLIGMRERVQALDGELSAGPAGDHPGWRVQARIPYQGEVRT